MKLRNKRFLAVLGQGDLIPLVGQDRIEQFPSAFFVVNYQYFHFCSNHKLIVE